jgi:AAHS family cis,cis-muconate transporter-like MFS transporter
VYSIGTLLAAEYVPTAIRTTVLGILQAGWSVGYVIAALLSAYVIPTYGWRALFFCAIVPGIVSLLMLRGVQDPPSWRAARAALARGLASRGRFAAIVGNAETRRMFLLWSATAIALQFAYYGANTWLPSYVQKDLGINLANTGWYVAGTYAMMVLGKALTGYLADIVGRKTMWVASGVAAAIYLPILISYATPANVPYLLLVFGLLYGAPYAVNATYMSESFPTSVRGTAVAASYNVGRIGSTISPRLIGWVATSYSIGFGIGLLAVADAVCAIIPGLFIKERLYDPKAISAEVVPDVPGVPAAASSHGARTSSAVAR